MSNLLQQDVSTGNVNSSFDFTEFTAAWFTATKSMHDTGDSRIADSSSALREVPCKSAQWGRHVLQCQGLQGLTLATCQHPAQVPSHVA